MWKKPFSQTLWKGKVIPILNKTDSSHIHSLINSMPALTTPTLLSSQSCVPEKWSGKNQLRAPGGQGTSPPNSHHVVWLLHLWCPLLGVDLLYPLGVKHVIMVGPFASESCLSQPRWILVCCLFPGFPRCGCLYGHSQLPCWENRKRNGTYSIVQPHCHPPSVTPQVFFQSALWAS